MFLKIYGASTASLRKSECSTYNKYASASLLLNSLYLHRLFSKTLIQKYTVHLLRLFSKALVVVISTTFSHLPEKCAKFCSKLKRIFYLQAEKTDL